jgi:N-acyl-D-amino-acid deacylase
VAHIRNEHSNIWSALDEFIDVGSAEDIPLHLSHFKTAGSRQHGKSQRAIEIIESARERGVDITADQYPYTAGSTMLASFLPSRVRSGSVESTINQLRQSREEVVNYLHTETEPSWDEMVITSVQTETNNSYVGMSVTDIAADMDVTPPNAVIDLLINEKLEVEQYSYHSIEEDVTNILEYKNSAIATDGLLGGKPHPRTYGTYPRVLGRYSRELNTFSIEEAIRMMTSLPARIIGIENKGIIRTGNDADLVVFDPEEIDSQATYENPKRFPSGIHYVFINGTAVVNKGKHTGQTPGTVLSKSP